MKKHFIFLITFLLFSGSMYSQQQKEQTIPDIQTLLLSYIENDSELKNLTLAAQKAELSNEGVKIDNGFDVTLSSGTINIRVADDKNTITAKPSVKASLPSLSNLSVSAQTNINSSDTASIFSDTSLSVGVDIISSNAAMNKITLLKSRRSVLEAQRKVQNRAVTAEKEFYTSLKSILSSINTIMSKKETLYTDTLDFEAKKIQGYSKSSSTYRQAELKVISDEHDVESAIHSFIYECTVFYKKCGYDIKIDENTELMTFVPSGLSEGEVPDVKTFDKELYTEIESAEWTHKINSMERSAKKNYSLSANAGYTFDNSSTKSNSLDAGLSGTIGGVSLGAGVSLPAGNNSSQSAPSFTLSASISPNVFRKNNITDKQNELTEEQELLAIQAAYSSYKTKLVELEQKIKSLNWEKESIEKNITMYEDLEKDMAKLYKQGYVNKNDYLAAKNSLNSSVIKKIINRIDFIIYSEDILLNFVNLKMETE